MRAWHFLAFSLLVAEGFQPLQVPVEWHVPVGCGFSGFLCEILGISTEIQQFLPAIRVFTGQCSSEFYSRQLSPLESRSFQELTLPTHVKVLDSCTTLDVQVGVETEPKAFEWFRDTDLRGADLPRFADGISVNNPAICDCLCDHTPTCVAWTFRQDDGMCWLKTTGFVQGQFKGLLSGYHSNHSRTSPKVVIWHGSCDVEHMQRNQREGNIAVARLMTESADIRQKKHHLECASVADEVWVPSQFHVEVFHRGGVPEHKLRVIPEAVNFHLFTPQPVPSKEQDSPVVFLSSFKWEHRKGWDLLLKAFWSTFSAEDGVLLRLRAWVPPWESTERNIDLKLDYFAERVMYTPREKLAPVEWIGSENGWAEELSRDEMVHLLQQSDVFVLPSRGEGWGLPVAEAMTSGIPTITTNFSGLTEFTSNDTCLLIPIDPTRSHGQYAEPSLEALKSLMKEAADMVKSKDSRLYTMASRARKHMISHFSPKNVSHLIALAVQDLVAQRRGHQ